MYIYIYYRYVGTYAVVSKNKTLSVYCCEGANFQSEWYVNLRYFFVINLIRYRSERHIQ